MKTAPARLDPEKSAPVRFSSLKFLPSKWHFRRSAPGANWVHGGIGVLVGVAVGSGVGVGSGVAVGSGVGVSVGTGVLVGGIGVGVSVGTGVGVSVGTGVGVSVGTGVGVLVGTGVFVGGTGVLVGGTGVFVGGTGVLVGGTGVFVGGTAVGATGVTWFCAVTGSCGSPLSSPHATRKAAKHIVSMRAAYGLSFIIAPYSAA